MLGKLDQRTAKALHSLKASQEWQVVKEWLDYSLTEIRQRSDRESSEIQLRWNQGACQILAELFKAQEDAKNALNKY